jgi:hypothetical protein
MLLAISDAKNPLGQEVQMKASMALILGIFSFSAFSTTVMNNEILLKNLIKLRSNLHFEVKEMIATNDSPSQQTYLNGLRSKLKGSKGIIRL